MRPRTSVYAAVSLDGFIARTNGAIDWLSVVAREGEDYGFKAFYDSIDTLLMGRKTYDTALSFETWPYAGKRCVVLTTDSARSPRHGEELCRGELRAVLDRLAEQGAKHVYVDGGTVVAQALREQLVDELTVSIIPVVLGEGTPLAPKVGGDVSLELLQHCAFESGLVQLKYAVRRGG
jgi:dihydrofolate reductase